MSVADAIDLMALEDEAFMQAWFHASDKERSACSEGFERYRRLMGGQGRSQGTPPEQEGGATSGRFQFVTVAEILRQPPVPWLVLRAIPGRGFIILYGASGSGKTFSILDIIAAIVRGLPWAGRRTRRGNVAYVAAEGQMRNRLDAYLVHHGLAPEDLSGLRILDSSVNLLDQAADVQHLLADLRALELEIGGISMVVVDTLNRVMPGGDENSSEDIGRVIAAAKQIENELGCAVLFVHHSGKDETKGSRGHSSLKAATDAELSVKREGDLRTITAEKVRDGEDGEALLTFRLQTVDLGPMSDFDPEAEPEERCTSCVVVPTSSKPDATRPARLSDIDLIALEAMRTLCEKTDDRTGATSIHPSGLPRVAIEAWREQFRIGRGVPKDAKALEASRKAFQRAVDKLTAQRIVGVHGARAWLW